MINHKILKVRGFIRLSLTFYTLLILIYILVGCSGKREANIKGALDKDVKTPEFQAYVIKGINIHREIIGLGSLEVMDKASVVARIDGILEKIYVKKGDNVRKGDELFYLSNYNLEIEYSKVEKALMEAEEELDTAVIQYNEEKKNLQKRFILLEKRKMEIDALKKEISFMADSLRKKEILFKKGGITEESYNSMLFSLDSKRRKFAIMNKDYELEVFGFRDEDIVEAGYKVPVNESARRERLIYINTELQRRRIRFAELSVKKSLLNKNRVAWLLSQRSVKSPTDGVVTDIGKFVGEKVNVDDLLTTVINLSSLVARVAFSERDIDFFRPGHDVKISIEGRKKYVDGVIYTVDPYVDPKTRTVKVDCIIKNFDRFKPEFLPGMFVRVTVPTDLVEQQLIIPKSSLVGESGREGFVYVISRDGRVYRRQVLYKEYNDKNYVVLNGIKANETIILNPEGNLRDGMKVKIKI